VPVVLLEVLSFPFKEASNRMHNKKCKALADRFNEEVKIIESNVSNYLELLKAVTGIDIAFYLIHSMEGSSKD
jgi:hypothetical protein